MDIQLHRKFRIICYPLALIAFLSGTVASAAPEIRPNLSDTRAEADWILAAQLPDGAIAHYVDKIRIVPYYSDFAARGLVAAAGMTGDARYTEAAWRYLEWYQSHEDANGYVTDYVVSKGVETSTGDMDSTDAYAGAFLIAVLKVWRYSGDTPRLLRLHKGVQGACKAIESTQAQDGLTWAKPSYHVKYLMDQAETYKGLLSAAQLGVVMDDADLASQAAGMAARMHRGVDALWNPEVGAYDWAKSENGVKRKTNWAVLGDACQQAWSVAFGLTEGARARALMQRFRTSQPGWDKPGAAGDYWPVVGWAFSDVGDVSTAREGYTSISYGAAASKRAWPFTPSIAGQLVVLQSKLKRSPSTGPDDTN